ncbi:kinesin-domain-containing protein [Coniophora puteana RWD-64-598 SS2]|uniref:Kinesin-domain-containing protein n=1 Tax=Coniophora puteana (strain RWD-64-598) TaxID=741705 RepID=A0A5M3MIH2_CONPW|nr:kinesin-domain-containing protein [Coniophora puteana RWD-64-598 SS2]EIW78847.1 kinesin-domain-containing protein [Coniophora puteana RWD-64-598 SS2]
MPAPPKLSTATRRGTRATSAPPKQGGPPSRRTVSNPASRNTASAAANQAAIAEALDAEHLQRTNLESGKAALAAQLAAQQGRHAGDVADALRQRHEREVLELELSVQRAQREAREATEELTRVRKELKEEREAAGRLRATVASQSTTFVGLNAQVATLQKENTSLRELEPRLEEAHADVERLEQEAREAEAVRRRLHNMVQELKGNIRVFCRVRPVLPCDREELGAAADMHFPDQQDRREIMLRSTAESAMGNERKEVYNFAFDRVFEPMSTQAEVFEEISLLAQSCVDGYNVCIFAYGQTGSGKSYTMEGGSSPEDQGMIPRAVDKVFQAAEELRSKGWEYTMEGQFLEIYNESINDLLVSPQSAPLKLDIKHDPKTSSTRVTNLTVLPLPTPASVQALLARANARRTVAATLANAHSSRSHSVFTLRLKGTNPLTGEKCVGCLNLVDLAGSERLDRSGAKGERLKETQSINKSLSALGDVIAALGEKGASGSTGVSDGKLERHIPYRNSKLTYLLQYSLSGSSKTLMILNLSPLRAHLGESLASLRFATKVNNTHVGTARKQLRG